jgi:hypothetical protein
MKQPLLLYISLAGLVILVYLFNILEPGGLSSILTIGFSIAMLAGLWLMGSSSNIRRTGYLIPLITGAVITLAGAMFMIQHWPWGRLMVYSGMAIIAVAYTVYYIRKPSKALLDHLKLAWLVTRITGVLFVLQHWPYGHIIVEVSNVLLIVTIFVFLYTENKKQPGEN